MMRHALAFLFVVALLSAAAAHAQVGPPIAGTEIFFGNDYIASSGNFVWDNIVVTGPSGTETITFTHPTSTGTGVYGPIHTEGSYQIEYFWIGSAYTNGITGGHRHLLTSGNPGDAENSHWQGATDRQGFVVRRIDGAPFSLMSVDYQNAGGDMRIGTVYTGWADYATWAVIDSSNGMVYTSTAWNTMNFGSLSPARLDITQTGMVFNAGTVQITGTVDAITTDQGFVFDDPAIDPLIGATVTINSNYSGPTTSFQGQGLVPGIVNLVASPGADELQIVNSFIHNTSTVADRAVLGGACSCIPTNVRALNGVSSNSTTRIGMGVGSGALDEMNGQLATQVMSLIFHEGATATPQLVAIALDYVAPAQQADIVVYTSGSGDMVIGAVGLASSGRLYNLMSVNPTAAVGSGPLFGLPFGAFQIDQIRLPQNSQPFHVTASPSGFYFWGIPAGTIPAGTVIDHVGITIDVVNGVAAPVEGVTRTTF